jgi:ABC-type glycerol-3-phosphate transport system permease component
VVPKVIGATVARLVLSALAGYGVCWLFPTDAKLARNFGFGAGVLAFSFAFIASFKSQFWLTSALPLSHKRWPLFYAYSSILRADGVIAMPSCNSEFEDQSVHRLRRPDW